MSELTTKHVPVAEAIRRGCVVRYGPTVRDCNTGADVTALVEALAAAGMTRTGDRLLARGQYIHLTAAGREWLADQTRES